MASGKLEQAKHFSRRTFVKAGGISALGLSLPQTARSSERPGRGISLGDRQELHHALHDWRPASTRNIRHEAGGRRRHAW